VGFERVTKSGTRQNLLTYLEGAQRRLADRQQEIASGRRLLHASDGPPEASEVLAQRRQLDRLAQFAKNSDSARSWLDTSASALTAGTDVLIRVRTLVVQASNGAQNDQSRSAIAAEVEAMAEQLLALANTTVRGRPVFAGTAGGPAFAADGSYGGSDRTVVRAVAADQTFEVGRPGPVAFGTFDGADPMAGNAIQVLRATAAAIRGGDGAAMTGALAAIDTASERMLSEVGRLGSLGGRLDALDDHRSLQAVDASRQLSQLEEVDLAEALVKLRSAEASYEATLAATARLLGSSLLDFLR
jgi:flagellar hook-associated protein 3 FlgL